MSVADFPAVTIRALRFQPLRIPFRVSFRHASADRAESESAWVEAESGTGSRGYGESCPRMYVTGESMETAFASFERWQPSFLDEPLTLEGLRRWTDDWRAEVDANPAAWCAIELALLDLLAKERNATMEELLSLEPLTDAFHYTAVVGDAGARAFRTLVEQYRQRGFSDFKVKLSGDLQRDAEKLDVFRTSPSGSFRLRVDANNLWDSADEAIAFLRELQLPLFAIEEPIRPNQYEDLARIGAATGAAIVLDESLLRAEQVEKLPLSDTPWLVNVRVSKMGGLFRSLEVVRAARRAGVGIIVGAQVGETSLLTRAALSVANAAGDQLIAQEGAFGTLLLDRDVCDPPLMFGAGGLLETRTYPILRQPGFGMAPSLP